jgi:hemerythrin
MEPFRFTTDLRLGIQAIDRQHVEWFQALEHLRKLVEGGGGEAGVPKALAFAVSYTQRHFSDEEAAMRAAKCPDLELHLAEHTKLVNQLCDLTAQHGDDMAVAHQVLDLMAGWARNHIAVHDKAAAPALAKAGG